MMVFLDLTHCRHCWSKMKFPYDCSCYKKNKDKKPIFELPLDEFEEEVKKRLDNIPIDKFVAILKKNGITVIDKEETSMNKKEIEQELNELKTRIEHLEYELSKESEPKGWFKPECGDDYYYIDCDGIYRSDVWRNHKTDIYRYEHHNCFRTQEDAQECDEYREALKEAEKPFVKGDCNYYFYYTLNREEIELQHDYSCINQGSTYLGQDEAVAQAFIDKWKPQILKYEFGIFE